MSTRETLYVRSEESIGTTGISFCPNEGNIKSLRKIIGHQMFIPGREVLIYFDDSEEVRRISPFHFEEARGLNPKQRRKFLDGVIEEVRYAERIALAESKID